MNNPDAKAANNSARLMESRPAFPASVAVSDAGDFFTSLDAYNCEGMTFRQYAAVKMMAAFTSCYGVGDHAYHADQAVKAADALILALAQGAD